MIQTLLTDAVDELLLDWNRIQFKVARCYSIERVIVCCTSTRAHTPYTRARHVAPPRHGRRTRLINDTGDPQGHCD